MAARRIASLALGYFACVFGAGFLFGAVRVLWLVPRLGVRWAELAEMPLMLAVIVAAARWTVRRTAPPPGVAARVAVGALALALLLGAETLLAFAWQGLTPGNYVASRDPVSGSAYVAMLLVFAAMPAWVGRKRRA